MMIGPIRSVYRAAFFAVALLGVSSCQKPKTAVTEGEPAPAAATPENPGAPVNAPIAAATPAPDPIAQTGIFFLLQKTSITTEDGIVGIKAGQVLQEVSAGTYRVGEHTLKLRSDQVTNNLRIAGNIAAADAAAQEAIRKAMQARLNPPAAAPSGTASGPARATPYPTIVASQPSTAASSSGPGLTAAPTPYPTIVATSRPQNPTMGAKLSGSNGFNPSDETNRRNSKTDETGRRYWRDSQGVKRYDY